MIGPNSKKFIRVDLPPEVVSIEAMLKLIDDKTRYKKYINEIISLTEKANSTIETLCKAEKVEGLFLDAEQKQEKAKEVVEKAKDEANKLVVDTRIKLNKTIESAQEEISEKKAEAENLMNKAKLESEAATYLMKKANDLMDEAKSLKESLDTRMITIEKAEHEINRKKELLSKL